MRLLALADEPPPADPVELVAANAPDVVVTLGDLAPDWIASLADADVPCIGVHGNHDGVDDLTPLGIRDLHHRRIKIGGWGFVGFEGCVRYGPGLHQYTQDQAAVIASDLPPADVLICHGPPYGVNDEPDDPAHVGFHALREWIDNHEPLYLLHGHTTPDPRRRVHRVGPTTVEWVRGARVLELH